SLLQKTVEMVAWLTPDGEPDPLIGAEREVGRPISRVDGPLKVAGKAPFTAEIHYEGLAYASLVLSTIAKGRIAEIEMNAAMRAKGVIAVMTSSNAPRMKAPPQQFTDRKSASTSNLAVMQEAEVRWNGEPVAAV